MDEKWLNGAGAVSVRELLFVWVLCARVQTIEERHNKTETDVNHISIQMERYIYNALRHRNGGGDCEENTHSDVRALCRFVDRR